MLTPKQCAERACVSLSLIYAWVHAGTLPHARYGRPGKRGVIRVDEAEFENFLQTMRVSGVPPEDEGDFKYL